MKPHNLIGNTFGRLTVEARIASNKYGQAMWLCRCKCGKEARTTTARLNRGHTQSCGCIKTERIRVLQEAA